MKSRVGALGKRVDLNLLVVFDAVYRTRNLGASGQSIGLSQPAMSHALNRLRALLKDPLFVRLPRGLQPTPYADTIAATVTHALAIVRGVLTEPAFDPATSARSFRLAMTDIGERVVLPRLCAHLAAHAPGISLETCQPGARELWQSMAAGEIDLAIGSMTQSGAGVRHQVYADSEYVCMVRAGHPAIRDSLTLRQFRQASHVLVASGTSTASGHAQAIEGALRGVGARVAVRNLHYLSLPGIVLGTDLVATLPRGLAELLKENLKVRIFPPPVELPNLQARIYWHERYHREPGNKWLRGAIAEAAPGRIR
jgi:DNA-binding transcriptional LysR family regulator